jgi:hypothetical protein
MKPRKIFCALDAIMDANGLHDHVPSPAERERARVRDRDSAPRACAQYLLFTGTSLLRGIHKP